MKKKIVTPAYISRLLGVKLSPSVQDKIRSYRLAYTDVSSEERDSIIQKIVATLLDPFLVYSGKHRLIQWEKGWGQNLDEFVVNRGEKSVIPRYFGKYPVVRMDQEWIKPASKDFEYNMLGVILDWLFDSYMKKSRAVYEFGCGTGHNLMRLREVNPDVKLWGLDWATSSQELIRRYAKKKKDDNLFAHRFDYFSPDRKFKLEEGSVVFTVASLEQIGKKHTKFVDYLLDEKPALCIHVEPIGELLDKTTLIDYLSIEYFKKRKYLDGFLTHLRDLEKKGKVEIHRAQRTRIGSLFIEGYSVIVWSPK
jgi:hypothetical protein